ncbi:MAG: class I SAM-dependent methyltransferase [Acidimicrobiia bacterium]|nr:class I SAM-dependent methyltransferase [Acidimicrobiia bacterium]
MDVSERFVELARAAEVPGATFERRDARELPYEAEFDAVVSLCQGAFGLVGASGPLAGVEPDRGGPRRRHGPGVAPRRPASPSAAFSAYFQLRWLEETDDVDAWAGVNHERTAGRARTGRNGRSTSGRRCSHPGAAVAWHGSSGLEVEAVWSVTPGE